MQSSQNRLFLVRVNVNFDGIIGLTFYAASSLVHHFVAIRGINWSYIPEMLNYS